jgi:hypothetical protein
MVSVTSYKFIYDNLGLEHIKCCLNNNKFFDIEIDDFFFYLLDLDKNLKLYSNKFNNWDELVCDLSTLGYPFETYFESYINTQFSEEELVEFTYSYI